MQSTLGKIFSRWHIEIFFLFFPETGFDMSCKIVFNGDNLHEMSNPVFWKNVINLLSDELVQEVVMVKQWETLTLYHTCPKISTNQFYYTCTCWSVWLLDEWQTLSHWSDAIFYPIVLAGLPFISEKSGKLENFQGQGKVWEFLKLEKFLNLALTILWNLESKYTHWGYDLRNGLWNYVRKCQVKLIVCHRNVR